MFSLDLRLLESVKVKLWKVFKPDDLNEVTKERIESTDDIIKVLQGYEVLTPITNVLKDRQKYKLRDIFYSLTDYWVNDLARLIGLTHPSRRLRSFIDYFLSTYVIREFVYALYEYPNVNPSHFKFLDEPIKDGLLTAKKVADIIESSSSYLPKPLLDTLIRYRDYSIADLDLGRFEAEVLERYWRELISISRGLRPSVKLLNVLRVLMQVESSLARVRDAVLRGEDPAGVVGRVEPIVIRTLSSVARKQALDYDLGLSAIRYIYCYNTLKSTPLTYDVILLYLISKEFEARIVSYMAYLVLNGFGGDYLISNLRRWLQVHASLTK